MAFTLQIGDGAPDFELPQQTEDLTAWQISPMPR